MAGVRHTQRNSIQRFESIDIAKAFAIILVVVGHFESDYMPHIYDLMHDVIYMFHMPLFMFASGFLYQATRKNVTYKSFIKKKFNRLMVPYFTVSVLVLCIKLSMQGTLPVENPVTLISFAEIFYRPAAGYFLWFIWALWWMMMIIPFFKTPLSRKILLSIAVILFFVSPALPDLFCLDETRRMLIFFVGGTVVSDYMKQNRISSFSALWQVISVIAFAVLAIALLKLRWTLEPIGIAIMLLSVNITGIAMSMTIAFRWRVWAPSRLVNATYSIANASYLIYLLHTTFEGFAKGVLYKIHWFDQSPQLLTAWGGAVVVIAAGVVVPWWLARYVFCRSYILSFLFGVSYRKRLKEDNSL